jgi:ABC-type transport system involved in multi-copper enzyme maturation permease subunit
MTPSTDTPTPTLHSPTSFPRSLFPAHFGGPVFRRELAAASRRTSLYVSRFLFLLLLGGILWIVYLSAVSETRAIYSSPASRLQDLQRMAPSLALAVLWVQAIALAFTAPSALSGSFCDERRRKTLDALLTTPLKPWQICLGKLAAGLSSSIILALLAVPILLAIRVYGGIDATSIFAGLALAFSLALLGGTFSMLASIWSRKASTASFFAFLFLLIAVLGPLLLVLFIQLSNMGAPPSPSSLRLMNASAISAMISLNFSILGATGGIPFDPIVSCSVASTYHLILSALAFLLSTVLVRRLMLATSDGGATATVIVARKPIKKSTNPATPAQPTTDQPAPDHFTPDQPAQTDLNTATDQRLVLPPGVRRKTSRDVGDTPVLWRELSQPLLKRPIVGALLLIALCGFCVYLFLALRAERLAAFFISTLSFSTMLLLQAGTSTTGGISSEREARTWDVLLTTPLTPTAIILGKLAGALRSLWLLPTVIALNIFCLGVLSGSLRGITLLNIALALTGPVLLLCALGVRFSLTSRKSSAASTKNTMVALALWVGLPLAVSLLRPVLELAGFSYRFEPLYKAAVNVVLALNPYPLIVSSLMGGWGAQGRYFIGDENFVDPATFTLISAGICLAYAIAAALVTLSTIRSFAKGVGRSQR